MSRIELLAPAKDLAAGLAAIDCGADAVYIGPRRFGAREGASNAMADLEQLCQYAHKYWVKVYATVNTIFRDAELPEALKLMHELYHIGIDAAIIQDVGLLECDLPPLPLIASTQMHNNTPEKVQFLEQVGFKRAILARELTLQEILEIRKNTSLELEFFVHGSLCVSYSGQCYLSYALGGRSANRGECAQPCRKPYNLRNGDGRLLISQSHLLSLKDLNLSPYLRDLLNAGVTSFKIEGRLKDKAYVMNVVGYYRKLIDELLKGADLKKSSSGHSELGFSPDPAKTFNRGYTSCFLKGRRQDMAALDTPKSLGEQIGKVISVSRNSFHIRSTKALRSGDGLCWFDRKQVLRGSTVNNVINDQVYPDKMGLMEIGTMIYRNHDHAFYHLLKKSGAARKIAIGWRLEETASGFLLSAEDEDGCRAEEQVRLEKPLAQQAETVREAIQNQLHKLGASEFKAAEVIIRFSADFFFPISAVSALRKRVIQQLQNVRAKNRPQAESCIVPNCFPFPEKTLTYMANVLNQKAAAFYARHGVESLSPAAEAGLEMTGKAVMTTRYCLRYQLGFCTRQPKSPDISEPLFLEDENGKKLRLSVNCDNCEMSVYFA